MDESNLTMEEYIKIEAEKARRREQTFNWETATYGKVRYQANIDYFKDFEIDFPEIVSEDVATPEPEASSKPAVSPLDDKQIDFRISFDESDDEDYVVSYDNNLFSYKIISVNNLKTDSENDIDKVNIPSNDVVVEQLGNDMAPLLPRDQRHPWLRYEGLQYTVADITDFEGRLGKIYDRRIHRVLIAFSIAGRSQPPNKVTSIDLFYLRIMDVRLLTEMILQGYTVIVRDLPVIDMDKLVRLRICDRLVDTWAWVAPGPERQQAAAAGAPEVVEGPPAIDEGVQAIPEPVQAPQPPPAAAPAVRTMP
ncbi:hypothetical protein Tco_0923226 [Tanacetum coccineum]|uniref:Uncharacterized protein n=1 Tax=Tanacetum coccineum TaxID=301880 RepID=A0ABQ5D385_9ASTR